MEADCSARLWLTGAAHVLPHRRFLKPTGRSLKIYIPESTMPEIDLEWKIPEIWNACPRDPWGNRGLYEETVLNTPILEDFTDSENYKGIDILRTIRSFDPCMPCTTHIHVQGSDHVILREVNTYGCGLDE